MDITLPKLGEGADSGSVVSIMVKVGDRISAGQILLELENEKAVAPIPSPAAGIVTQIYVKEGQRLSVGQRILAVAEGTEAGASPASPTNAGRKSAAPAKPVKTAAKPVPEEAPEEPAPEAEPESIEAKSESPADEESEPAEPSAKTAGPPPASPGLRRLAREIGLDLTRIKGSERGGRIVLKDVQDHIQRLQKLAFAPKPAKVVPPTAGSPAPAPAPVSIDFSQWGPILKKPLSALRRTISRRLQESWTTVPRVTQFDEADITELNELRRKYNAEYETRGARLTLTPFVLKAVVAALQQSPVFNASLDEATQEIVLKEYYHLGLAVDTEAGLIVPVLRDVDQKSLLDLAKELSELAEKARNRKVTPDELKGGTFTISNQGGIGGGHFTPIVNQPEVAILGLGRSTLKPVVRQDRIEPRLMMPLCVSYDHRVIDGGNAARFIVQIVKALESFPEKDVKLA